MSIFIMEAFLPIGEEEEMFEIVEEPTEETTHPVDNDIVEVDLKKPKARTAVLALEAEEKNLAMQRLLGKTDTGTATCAEKDRLLSLH